MNLVLERYSYGYVKPYRRPTEGRLFIGDHTLFTLEDPWNNNRPFDSCIPDGVYDLVPHSTAKHPDTWALVNPSLNIYHLPDDREKTPIGTPALFTQATGKRMLRAAS